MGNTMDTSKVYKLQNIGTNGYLDTYGGYDRAPDSPWHNGGRVQIGNIDVEGHHKHCTNQLWKLVDYEDNKYKLQNVGNGGYLDTYGGYERDPGNHDWHYNGRVQIGYDNVSPHHHCGFNNQTWKFIDQGDSIYKLESCMGGYLDTYSGYDKESGVHDHSHHGGRVQIGKVDCTPDDEVGFANQTWRLIECGTVEDYYSRVNETNWMKAVPDYVNISELSIPGTHDSCARHNGHSFGFAKCQDKGLREQLNKGIRFIDIRVKRTKKKGLCVFHGEGWKGKIPLFVDQEKHFREVLEICHSFLSDNPSETILMSLKEEDVFSNLDDFKHQFNTAVNRMGESLAGRFLDSTSSPILRDARGKIVLFKRSGTQHVEIRGIDITDFENKWRPNPGEGKVWYNVSDRYELYFKGFNMNDKKEAVREHIQAAQDHPGSIFFTFLSAFKGSPVIPGSLTPKEVANNKNGMNLYATKLFYQMTDDSFGFRTPSVSRKFGIIAMDFFGDIMPHPRSRHYRPTCEMVARIIISNPGVSSWW